MVTGKSFFLKNCLLIGILFIICFPVYTQNNIPMNEQGQMLLSAAITFKDKISPDAKDYNLVSSLKNKINDDNVFIFRFEPIPSKSLTLHGEHATVILDTQSRLKGYSHISPKMKGSNDIPERQAMVLAIEFFHDYARDIYKSTDFQWTNSHKEKVKGNDGKEISISGSWVKFREKQTGEYLWVILAPDGSIMEFDRDIVWSFFKGGRVNELWLRDEWLGKWLKKNNK